MTEVVKTDCSRFVDQDGCCFSCHEEGNVKRYRTHKGVMRLCECMAADMRLSRNSEATTAIKRPAVVRHEERRAIAWPDDPDWDP